MAVLLTETATAMPERLALIDQDGTTTWSALNERVNRLVHALRARGLGEGDAVVVMGGNQRETVEVVMACLHGGWLLVPVNWHWTADELAHVIGDATPKAVIAGAAWAATAAAADAAVAGERVRVAFGDDVPTGFERYESVLAEGSPDEPAEQVRGGVMFYTSGTTGHPKGVRGGLSGIGGGPEYWLFVAASINNSTEFDPADAAQLVCGPIYHSAQWVFCHMPLIAGATVVLQHRFDAAEVLELIDRHGVTNTHLVPAQFVRLLRLDEATRRSFSGASLRKVFHGAAPCPADVKRQMIEWWGPIITEYYGGTEGGFISKISAEEWLQRPASVGRPFETIELLVIGPNGERLGSGEAGDLYFRSLLGVDFEYHNAEEKTANAHLEPGVATLGDIGWIDSDGYLFLSDRRIDMIISGGVNIYPAEIESVLGGHPAVMDAAVFGIPDDDMGEQVHAAIVPVDGHVGGDDLAATLEAAVREQLAGYKVPRSWTFHEALPRTDTGKLLKRTLREPYWSDRERAI